MICQKTVNYLQKLKIGYVFKVKGFQEYTVFEELQERLNWDKIAQFKAQLNSAERIEKFGLIDTIKKK